MSVNYFNNLLCMSRGIFVLALLSICVGTVAVAARFPDAIEKSVVLKGAEAVEVARLLGLGDMARSKLELPLGPNDAWAVCLLKEDTTRTLSHSDDRMPQKFNSVAFASSPNPSITFGPFWLDGATALPNAEPGVYSFSSPWVSPANFANNSWGTLLSALKKENAGKLSNPNLKVERVFSFANGAELVMQLWANDEKEYSGRIVVRHLPVEESVVRQGSDITFLGTVKSIEASALEPPSLDDWVVTFSVDKVIKGVFSGQTFSFRIHSQVVSGLERGKKYLVNAKWNGTGYEVDEFQWNRHWGQGVLW